MNSKYFEDEKGNKSSGRVNAFIAILCGVILILSGITLTIYFISANPPYSDFYDYALKFGEKEIPNSDIFINLVNSYFMNKITFSSIISIFGIAVTLIGIATGGKTFQTKFENKQSSNELEIEREDNIGK